MGGRQVLGKVPLDPITVLAAPASMDKRETGLPGSCQLLRERSQLHQIGGLNMPSLSALPPLLSLEPQWPRLLGAFRKVAGDPQGPEQEAHLREL